MIEFINNAWKVAVIIASLMIASMSLWAQNTFYPPAFGQIKQFNQFQCPSAIGIRNNFEVSLINQNMLQGWEKVMNSMILANYSIRDRSEINHNTIGILAGTFREGKYLQKNTICLIYSWKTRITKSLFFSGGFKAGCVDYVVRGTAVTGEGASVAPDAAASVSVFGQSFLTSISLNSVFAAKLQPIYETTLMPRFLILYHEQSFKHNRWLRSTVSGMIQYPYYYSKFYGLNYEIAMKDFFSLGTGYQYRNGMNFTAGFSNLNYLGGRIRIHVLYSFPVAGCDLNISRFELFLSYSSKK